MFCKLAVKNVRKSLKDFTVYFLTLTFGVCIFYVFNSMEAQQAVMNLSEVQGGMMAAMTQMIGYVSVFVSFILAFLILYANKFMMKRRKKELGVYMVLGMRKGKISMILLVETLIIGFISLVVGLLLGVFASQGLALLTANMFAVKMKEFQFIFSSSACWQTILYFGIIFVLVMVFNFFTISSSKLIKLLNASRQNEKFKAKKLWISVVLFLLSVACLGMAYALILKNGMNNIDMEFTMSIVLGSIGTLLFFMSLSGFLLRVVKSNKRLYYKGLNMFVLRQINSKINTTYVSMTFICIMLLLSIGILSVGSSFGGYMDASMTPYDASVECYGDSNVKDIEKALKNDGRIDFDSIFESALVFQSYDSGVSQLDIIRGYMNESDLEDAEYLHDKAVVLFKESDYNNAVKLLGKEPIHLGENGYALLSNTEESIIQQYMNQYMQDGKPFSTGGKTLTPAGDGILRTGPSNTYTAIGVVVPDAAVTSQEVFQNHFSGMYKGDKEKAESAFSKILSGFNGYILVRNTQPGDPERVESLWSTTKIMFYEQTVGMKMMFLFIGIYMGLIFLVAAAAVLALQQLSDASDNAPRYQLLNELGVEKKMLGHAILKQVAIYFFIPIFLAAVHAVVGISALNGTLLKQGIGLSLQSVLMTGLILLLIYGVYFIATYFGCKRIARTK